MCSIGTSLSRHISRDLTRHRAALVIPAVVWAALSAGGTLWPPSGAHAQEPFDLLLVGGKVLDGSGNPSRSADVAVHEGRIAAVGDLRRAEATRRIDITGLTVAPGFIDVHSHADGPNGEKNGLRAPQRERRSAPNLVSQGITTVVVNPDGGSPQSIAQQRASLERLGVGPNVILMVGHNTIRRQALGTRFRRVASPSEVQTMASLLRRGVAEGAWGMTAGLEYVPGRWSDTEELLELVAVLRDTGGVYIVHERASGSDPIWFLPSRDRPSPPTLLDSIQETITIAEHTGVPTVATHIKLRGADYWGNSGAVLDLVSRARQRGVELWLDQYPYDTTGSDGETVLIPPWALEHDRSTTDGTAASSTHDYAALLRTGLEDDDFRNGIERDIAREITRRGGADRIFITEFPDASEVGQSLADYAQTRELDPVQAAMQLQLDGFADRPGGARLLGYSLSEADVEPFAAQPYTLTASDAGIALSSERRPVHARFYGTFPRKIGHYAVERGLLRVEDAVRSATSLPAQVLRLSDRGQVQEGMAADLVVLDLERVRDRATFAEPHQYAEGIQWVFVGGEAVVEDTHLTGVLPGRVLTLRDSGF